MFTPQLRFLKNGSLQNDYTLAFYKPRFVLFMRLIFLSAMVWLISATSFAQNLTDSAYVREFYDKTEFQIPMRDGVKLHTVVYTPKDISRATKYPFLMQRTPYNAGPYGPENFRRSLGPSSFLMREGYIFVYQDVRGRYMSEGLYDNMRPNIEGNNKRKKKEIDESSDTFDTIEWLLKNVKNNNGKVGQWGISYPGFYTAAALPDAHPALAASSPQAPIADFYFDDFHHHGAFLMSYLMAYPVFGHQKDSLTSKAWYSDKWDEFRKAGNMQDGYEFYLGLGALKNVTETIYPDDFFWNQTVEHPNYDEFWQKRSILPHLKNIDHAVLTVGGWYDAEDLYGPLNIYKTIEANNPDAKNAIVMGPWTHGDWARERGHQTVNHIWFGDSLSTWYQREIEMPFFEYNLKGKSAEKHPEALMFDTGIREWKRFDTWPPEGNEGLALSFHENGRLGINEEQDPALSFAYVSDPSKPVPYRSETEAVRFTPRPFITDDQRHASRRPDVLTFQSEILTEEITVAGEILASLVVELSAPNQDKLDADFVVKLIDVYAADHKNFKTTPSHISLAGYQQLVRHETFRGRFRESYAEPKAFKNGVEAVVDVPLQDILHTFKKGHRIMIQVHSTWFPYIDRNPQKYVENIYKADNEDFIPISITVKGSSTVKVGGSQIDAVIPQVD